MEDNNKTKSILFAVLLIGLVIISIVFALMN